MNIVRTVEAHLDEYGWPDLYRRVGPATCSPKCRKRHAYAYLTDVKAVYDRPCDIHDSALPLDRRKKLGLPGKPLKERP